MKEENQKLEGEEEKDSETGVDSHAWMKRQLDKAVEADQDLRANACEAHLMVDKRGHMWEESRRKLAQKHKRPMYTVDMLNPNIDLVSGHMQQLEYTSRVQPTGGGADETVAETYQGLLRHMDNISFSKRVYDQVDRNGITCGFDAVELVQDYITGETLDQDIFLRSIPDAVKRVFFGPHSEPDASDADYCFVLYGLSSEDYDEQYPDSTAVSEQRFDQGHDWENKPEQKLVGDFRYFREEKKTIALLSNNEVVDYDDEFKSIEDELFENDQIEVMETREISQKRMYSRLFSENDWLDDERETVFKDYLNVIPYYANFKVFGGKVVYWGLVEKLRDQQFVLNYSVSKEVEESAFAPTRKLWMTNKMIGKFKDKLKDLNNSADPVQFYEPDERVPNRGPFETGGPQPNQQLRSITETMRGFIQDSTSMYHQNRGQDVGGHSGVAIEALQERGDLSNNKYVTAGEVMRSHVCRVAVRAFAEAYEPGRQLEILGEDGSKDTITIGYEVFDRQSGKVVVVNDLKQGTYDVVCEAGPRMVNKQNETVRALTEIAAVYPEILARSSDIIAKNITSPGMKEAAERERQALMTAGVIPPSQWTDEEIQAAQQAQAEAQANQANDPMMVAAMAEMEKAKADAIEAETEQIKVRAEIALKADQIEVNRFEAQTKRYEVTQKVPAEIEKLHASASRDLVETLNKALNP